MGSNQDLNEPAGCLSLFLRNQWLESIGIGATVVTLDIGDFKRIQSVVDFRYRDVIKEA